jgi:hypothetical protein
MASNKVCSLEKGLAKAKDELTQAKEELKQYGPSEAKDRARAQERAATERRGTLMPLSRQKRSM